VLARHHDPTIATPSDQRPSYSSNRMIALDQNYEGPRSNISFVDFLHRQVARGLLQILPIGTKPNSANSLVSLPECIRHESRRLDYLGGFAGDALGHHLDCLRYLEDDRRRPISENGYIALGVGAALSLSVGCGLMALLFYRRRHE